MRSFKWRVLDRDIEFARLSGVVVDNQKFLFRRLAQECVVIVVPSNVPLLSRTQGGVTLTQREQRLYVREYILLFSGAAGGGEGVTRIAGKPSRKVAPVVGIASARHGNFVAVIDLWNPAQGQQQ